MSLKLLLLVLTVVFSLTSQLYAYNTERKGASGITFYRDGPEVQFLPPLGPPPPEQINKGPQSSSQENIGPQPPGQDNKGPPLPGQDNKEPPPPGQDNKGPPPPDQDNKGPLPPGQDNKGPPPPGQDNKGPQPPDQDNKGPQPSDQDNKRPPPPGQDNKGPPLANEQDARPPPPGQQNERPPPNLELPPNQQSERPTGPPNDGPRPPPPTDKESDRPPPPGKLNDGPLPPIGPPNDGPLLPGPPPPPPGPSNDGPPTPPPGQQGDRPSPPGKLNDGPQLPDQQNVGLPPQNIAPPPPVGDNKGPPEQNNKEPPPPSEPREEPPPPSEPHEEPLPPNEPREGPPNSDQQNIRPPPFGVDNKGPPPPGEDNRPPLPDGDNKSPPQGPLLLMGEGIDGPLLLSSGIKEGLNGTGNIGDPVEMLPPGAKTGEIRGNFSDINPNLPPKSGGPFVSGSNDKVPDDGPKLPPLAQNKLGERLPVPTLNLTMGIIPPSEGKWYWPSEGSALVSGARIIPAFENFTKIDPMEDKKLSQNGTEINIMAPRNAIITRLNLPKKFGTGVGSRDIPQEKRKINSGSKTPPGIVPEDLGSDYIAQIEELVSDQQLPNSSTVKPVGSSTLSLESTNSAATVTERTPINDIKHTTMNKLRYENILKLLLLYNDKLEKPPSKTPLIYEYIPNVLYEEIGTEYPYVGNDFPFGKWFRTKSPSGPPDGLISSTATTAESTTESSMESTRTTMTTKRNFMGMILAELGNKISFVRAPSPQVSTDSPVKTTEIIKSTNGASSVSDVGTSTQVMTTQNTTPKS